jgi:Fasciclin domain
MEKRAWTTIGGLLGLFFIAMIACKKTPPPKPAPITPLQTLVNSDTTLTLFHQMILVANDAGLLQDTTVTILIPTNAVLEAAGYTNVTIDSTSSFLLDQMIRYQYILGALSPDSGTFTAYPTYLGAPLYIEKTASGLLMNGGATAPNVGTAVGKATVYYLSSLLPQAVDSLPILLEQDTSLTMFAAAFSYSNVYDSLLLNGSYTIFAPVNSAFYAAGFDSVTAIDSTSIDSVIALVQGQVVNGVYFTNTFPIPGPVFDYVGNPITIGNANGGWQFYGNGSPVPANWLSGNVVSGANMVLHKIDAILPYTLPAHPGRPQAQKPKPGSGGATLN